MPLLRNDERFLYRALELATAAAAFASPNPAVGCVLTRGEDVLGEGAHRYDRRDHAEIAALGDAAARGQSAGGATAYVTLEPCSHHGRTGPCADALIAAGIARCVVATVDPNPVVSGSGLAKLQQAGVEVTVADPDSAVAIAARRLNDAFAFSVKHGRPFVTLKAAISSDGKLAPPPAMRTATAPHWLTGPAARADVQTLRHGSDAILTGIGTVLADDPELTDRTGLPRRRPLQRIVLDSELRTPLQSRLVRSAQNDLLLICTAEAAGPGFAERQAALRERGVEVVTLPASREKADFFMLFGSLLHARDVRSVLVEAGPTLNGSLLRSNVVDRLILYKAPIFLGSEALPFATGEPDVIFWEQQLSGVTRASFPHGAAADLRVTGYLHDPWQGV